MGYDQVKTNRTQELLHEYAPQSYFSQAASLPPHVGIGQARLTLVISQSLKFSREQRDSGMLPSRDKDLKSNFSRDCRLPIEDGIFPVISMVER